MDCFGDEIYAAFCTELSLKKNVEKMYIPGVDFMNLGAKRTAQLCQKLVGHRVYI
jgi:hypothetical protein